MHPATSIKEILDRAARWASETPAVNAVVVYGSAHHGSVHDHSDVDLIIVTAHAQRQRLWHQREGIAATLLDEPVSWAHDLTWQGPHRYQAWRADLHAVDLTFDESVLAEHEVLDDGYRFLVDKKIPDTTRNPTAARSAIRPHDPEALDQSTWVWLLGLHGWLRHGRRWQVYSGLVALVDARVAPLVRIVHGDHDPTERLRNAGVVPAGTDLDELDRALRAATRCYDELRTEADVPESASPLMPAIRRKILTSDQ